MRPFSSALVVAATLALGSHARAAEPRSYDVRATLDDDGRLSGTLDVDVRVGEDGTVRLWFYADRLAVAPSALDQHNARWIFPREIDLSELDATFLVDGQPATPTWERHEVGGAHGRDYRGADAALRGLAPGHHHVRVRFAYDLPERFGRLGRIRGRVTMTAPWYPLVIDDTGASRHDVRHHVALQVPPELVLWDGRRIVRGSATWSQRTWFVPVVAAPRLHRRTQALPGGRTLTVLSHRALYQPPAENAPGVFALEDIARVDVVGQVARVAADAVRTLSALDVPVPGGARDLVVALVPSRTELAGVAPGLVCASDRLYEILPQEDVLAFHDRALQRSMFRALVAPLVDAVDAPADRVWSEDLRAVLLVDLDTVRRQGRNLSARDLIGWAGFHPLVDQLLYAPQVSFVDVWFGIAEPDPFRDAPERSRRPTARGRRLVEAARDALPEDDFAAWTRALLQAHRGARASLVASDAAHERLLDDWLRAPATELNYRLVGVESERTEEGWRHVVRVARQLGPGSRARIEPVEVRIQTDAAETETERWFADASQDDGEVDFETRGALVDVQIDPRGRVVQSPAVSGGHPRRDDTNRLPFRPPILQGFNLALGATEGAFIGLVDFALRRRYDLENSVSLRLDTGPRSVGGLLRYRRGVGRKRDNNSRIGFVMGGLELDRLRADFSDEDVGGWRGAALLQGGFSTLRWFLDPRRGESLAGSIRAGVVRRDDGSRTWTLTPSLRGNITRPIGLRGAIVLVAAAAYAFGDPLPAERPGLGGRFGLRGYQFAELVGRGVAFAVAELRFTPTFLSDLAINGLHLVWLREIQLAVFGGIGGVFEASDGRDAVLGAEVGGGVRVHFEYGGVQPAVLALDLAVPLVRSAEARASFPPVTTILAFEQYF